MYIRDILRYITGRGAAERDLGIAADIAQNIVLALSAGDSDHNSAVELRDLIGRAYKKEAENGDRKATFDGCESG